MGWTERQIKEDNTIEFIEQINVFMAEKENAEKIKDMKNKVHAPPTHAHRGRR